MAKRIDALVLVKALVPDMQRYVLELRDQLLLTDLHELDWQHMTAIHVASWGHMRQCDAPSSCGAYLYTACLYHFGGDALFIDISKRPVGDPHLFSGGNADSFGSATFSARDSVLSVKSFPDGSRFSRPLTSPSRLGGEEAVRVLMSAFVKFLHAACADGSLDRCVELCKCAIKMSAGMVDAVCDRRKGSAKAGVMLACYGGLLVKTCGSLV